MGLNRNVPTDLPSDRIVTRVAEREGADPAALPPLYYAVDPGPLDDLIEAQFDGFLHFEYAGYHVRLYGDGAFDVRERDGDDGWPRTLTDRDDGDDE